MPFVLSKYHLLLTNIINRRYIVLDRRIAYLSLYFVKLKSTLYNLQKRSYSKAVHCMEIQTPLCFMSSFCVQYAFFLGMRLVAWLMGAKVF